MDILIIGGTQFVGRALSEEALRRGHNLTLFHRGQTNPDILPDAERIQGDRDGEISNLGDQAWDVVIDTCGYVPRVVELSAEYLQDRVQQYCFISTISVYEDSDQTGRDESAPLKTIEDETTEEINGETYGPLKVLCEQTVEEYYPERYLHIRPGLIVGPHDPTNRFTYWPVRIREGGDVLAPGGDDYPVQFIDVRDLATFTLDRIEAGDNDAYNATGPDYELTLGDWFTTCKDVSGSDAKFVWVDDDFLIEEQSVQPFAELPLWVPKPEVQPFMSIDVSKATDAGLTFRPLAETVQDTLDWVDSVEGDLPGSDRAGMSREREQEIIAAYRDAQDD